MQVDNTDNVDASPSGTAHDSDPTPPLSAKLRDKLMKLAKWRIDPSLIEFQGDTPEFEGGHATVSRALFTSASAAGANINNLENADGGSKSGDGNARRK
ncbi:hypothetical protein FRC00_008807, partial [Tulasnella sp. 408]